MRQHSFPLSTNRHDATSVDNNLKIVGQPRDTTCSDSSSTKLSSQRHCTTRSVQELQDPMTCGPSPLGVQAGYPRVQRALTV